MKSSLHIVASLSVMSMAGGAMADVKVENQVIQSGLYAQSACKPEGIEGFNECVCLADIHTPVISGLPDPLKEKELNATFAAFAEKQKCEGKETQQEGKDEPATSTYNFEVSYQSPALLALRFESWGYSGGAHGNGSVGAAIMDVAQARMLGNVDIFSKEGIATVNKFINDSLSAEPEGEVFHDSIDAFKGEFLTESECKSCAIVLAQDGLKVVFQTYAVSSFANGPMEVSIPAQYVHNDALKVAIEAAKPIAPVSDSEALNAITVDVPAEDAGEKPAIAAAPSAPKKLPDPIPVDAPSKLPPTQ